MVMYSVSIGDDVSITVSKKDAKALQDVLYDIDCPLRVTSKMLTPSEVEGGSTENGNQETTAQPPRLAAS